MKVVVLPTNRADYCYVARKHSRLPCRGVQQQVEGFLNNDRLLVVL